SALIARRAPVASPEAISLEMRWWRSQCWANFQAARLSDIYDPILEPSRVLSSTDRADYSRRRNQDICRGAGPSGGACDRRRWRPVGWRRSGAALSHPWKIGGSRRAVRRFLSGNYNLARAGDRRLQRGPSLRAVRRSRGKSAEDD